jgi:hypothetical protein
LLVSRLPKKLLLHNECDMNLPRSIARHYLLFLICLFQLVTAACASSDSGPTTTSGTAMLSWDASVGPDVAGYKIYHAPMSGAYGAPFATVTMDVTSYTVTGLESGTNYFFTVTAYNSDGAESSFSNEVNKTIL